MEEGGLPPPQAIETFVEAPLINVIVGERRTEREREEVCGFSFDQTKAASSCLVPAAKIRGCRAQMVKGVLCCLDC